MRNTVYGRLWVSSLSERNSGAAQGGTTKPVHVAVVDVSKSQSSCATAIDTSEHATAVESFQSASANISHCFRNDLWADAAKQLSNDNKQRINFSWPDKLNILAELHADAERLRQRSIKSR